MGGVCRCKKWSVEDYSRALRRVASPLPFHLHDIRTSWTRGLARRGRGPGHGVQQGGWHPLTRMIEPDGCCPALPRPAQARPRPGPARVRGTPEVWSKRRLPRNARAACLSVNFGHLLSSNGAVILGSRAWRGRRVAASARLRVPMTAPRSVACIVSRVALGSASPCRLSRGLVGLADSALPKAAQLFAPEKEVAPPSHQVNRPDHRAGRRPGRLGTAWAAWAARPGGASNIMHGAGVGAGADRAGGRSTSSDSVGFLSRSC